LNSDHHFYWRRAAAEYQAAARAVTPAARARRHELAETYVRRLRDAGIAFRFDQAPQEAERPRASDSDWSPLGATIVAAE
jgi:Holliday junction resolvase-like predicted endonuclease